MSFSGILLFYSQPLFGLTIINLGIPRQPNLLIPHDPLKTIESETFQESENSSDYTTESTMTQIPVPLVSIMFEPYSCIWLTEFYLCHEHGSRYCIVIFGSRPQGTCILGQRIDDVPEVPDGKYYIERFCSEKQLVRLVGPEC